ncbi:MAG: branched-chain amino acid ABC transporter permease [Proteobacteria bacterium]|nr:branched-chain amino acid ABC transporter permease [Pseudomonadota bacterium]
MRGWVLPAAIFAALAVLPFLPLGAQSGFVMLLATRAMILGLAALSLDLMLGGGGLVSFGHAAFLGLGAYAVAMLDAAGMNDALYVVPAALGAAVAFALPTGAIALRTRGVNYIMITLAFAQMLFFAFGSLADYGGDDGYTLNAHTTIGGVRLLAHPGGLYAATLLLLLLAYALCRVLLASRFGRALRGVRQNRARMQALGYDPFALQLAATLIGGALCALAGVLLVNQAEFASPAYASWQRSGDLLMMVILGGVGSLHGAILGAAAVVALEEALSRVTEHWPLIYGPLLVLAVIFLRGGLAGIGAGIGKRRDA